MQASLTWRVFAMFLLHFYLVLWVWWAAALSVCIYRKKQNNFNTISGLFTVGWTRTETAWSEEGALGYNKTVWLCMTACSVSPLFLNVKTTLGALPVFLPGSVGVIRAGGAGGLSAVCGSKTARCLLAGLFVSVSAQHPADWEWMCSIQSHLRGFCLEGLLVARFSAHELVWRLIYITSAEARGWSCFYTSVCVRMLASHEIY